jgi:hypothetical protein
MNGGSANDDAFVDWHLTTGLSLQVAGTAIFILLRVDHVQCHVTPPHSSLPEKVLVPSTKAPKVLLATTKKLLYAP